MRFSLIDLRDVGVRIVLCGGAAMILSLGVSVTPAMAGDNVNGNLITFNNDGMWSWYMDERVIVDPTNDNILIGSVTSSPVAYPIGRPTGGVDVVTFDPATGTSNRFQLSDIQEDDHNAPGLIVLPDGRYLAMYSNHGNAFGLGDEWTRWRVSTNPHDSSSWVAEELLSWHDDVPGPDINVSYHNLFYLSAEDRVYNFSRGTNQAPNILLYDPDDNTAQWSGQLADSSAGGYSTGYFKYASNGVDRIYFTHTETHPRNFNTSIYSGYVENGQSYDMDGTLLDSNVFDSEDIGGSVPDVTLFTPVQLADASGTMGNFRLWTVDTALASDGNPTAMYVSRYYDSGPGNGSQTTPVDHRIHYARWDGDEWITHEIAQMGDRLYSGTDISEQDYTGNGALVPGDENTVYISTQFDPREFDPENPKTTPDTTFREIYEGVTADGGATWTWTPLTENSSVSNVRPLVPEWDDNHRAVVWMRGIYTTAQNTDMAIVGLVSNDMEEQGLVHYVDATTSNTTRATGVGDWDSGPAAGNGPDDDKWHWRTGFGNNGDVLTSGETTPENAPMLKTTLNIAEDGMYDIFAYFWANQTNDWRFLAGLDSTNLQLFRDNGAQQAELGQFDGAVTLTADLVLGAPNPDTFLYRAYLGRVDVMDGSPVDVFVDDFNSTGFTGLTRTWYDGVGYSLVTSTIVYSLADFNEDGFVDGADFSFFLGEWGVGGALGPADFNADSIVDGGDFSFFLGEWNPAPPGLARVPEPASLALMAIGGLMVVSRRRR